MTEDGKRTSLVWGGFVVITIAGIILGVLFELLKNVSWIADNIRGIYIAAVVALCIPTYSAWAMYLGWRKARKQSVIKQREVDTEKRKLIEVETALGITKTALEETKEALNSAIAQSKKYNVIKEDDIGFPDNLRGLLPKSMQQLSQSLDKNKLAGLDTSFVRIAFLSSFRRDADTRLLEYIVDLKDKICKDADLVVFHFDLKTINEELKIIESKENCHLRTAHISQIFDPIIICGVDMYLKYNDRWLYLGDEDFGRLSYTTYRRFLGDLYDNSIAVTYDKKHDYLGQISKKLSREITTEINRNGFAPCACESDLWLIKPKEYPDLFDKCDELKRDITREFENFEVGITGKSSKIVACWPLTHRGLRLRLDEDTYIRNWLERLRTAAENNPGLEVCRYLFISAYRDCIQNNGKRICHSYLHIPENYPDYGDKLNEVIDDFFPKDTKMPDNYKTYIVLTGRDKDDRKNKLVRVLSNINDEFDKIRGTTFGGDELELLGELASNWIFFYNPNLSVLQYEDLIEVKQDNYVKLLPVFYYQDTDIDLDDFDPKNLDIERKCHRYLVYLKALEQYRNNIRNEDPYKNTSLYLFGLYAPGSPFYETPVKLAPPTNS